MEFFLLLLNLTHLTLEERQTDIICAGYFQSYTLEKIICEKIFYKFLVRGIKKMIRDSQIMDP